MNDLVKSSFMVTKNSYSHNYDSTPQTCDSALHILQCPRNVPLDTETALRRFPLSNTTVVHLDCVLLMKLAPLSLSHSIRGSIHYRSNFVKFFCVFGHKKSTRRDSNPRPSPWQGDTPPLSHSCMLVSQPNNMYYTDVLFICQQLFSSFL